MDPVRLQIENFCSYSTADIPFSDFSSALIVGKINGNEKFSNGSGKSTIFSAIKYVLFNEVDFSTLDKAIRHGTDYCKIIFDFRSSLDNEIYRIVRSKSKKSGSEVRLFKKTNDAFEDITQRRNSDTEKEIAKIIKVNYKTFCNSVLFAQTDLMSLASLTAEKRKLALKEVLQLNVYSKYETVAKKKASDILKEVDKEKTILKTIDNPAEDVDIFEKELYEVSKNITIKNDDLISNKILFDKDNERLIDFSKRFEALERESAESLVKQKTTQDDLKKICEIVKDYENKIFSVEKDGSGLTKQLKELTTRLDKFQEEKLRDKDLIKIDIENYTQEFIDTKALHSSNLSKLEELKIPLPTGSYCKYCRQKIINKDSCQELIDSEISEKENLIKDIKYKLDMLDKKCRALKEELKKAETTESEIMVIKNDIISKTKEVESKRSVYSEFNKLLNENKNIINLKNKELEFLRKNQFIENAEEYSNLKLSISNIKAKLSSISSDLENTNKTIVSLSGIKAVLSHKIEDRRKDKETVNNCLKNISLLEEKYSLHQKVVQAFGSTGIPTLITHTILDDFQIETNHWLSRIRPGLQLQFSVVKDRSDGDKEDTLEINYILDGYDLEHAQLSGAQKFIVALSLKLGLTSVIKKRLGVEIGLILIDEVDKSIDEGGLEAFGDAIKELQRNFKVLVITHNNELKEKFNHAILVEKDENAISTARVVNQW